MTPKVQEIKEELKSVLSGSTFDAILPPIAFGIVNAIFGLMPAVLSALGLAVLLGLVRVELLALVK